MIDFLLQALRAHPELALFLAISLGVLLGRVSIRGFQLGSVAGALLMGLLIGQLGIDVPHVLKSIFFVLFLYAIGFKSGPEFFGSLNRGTLKLVVLSLVLCATALGTVFLLNHYLRFDTGFLAGLAAGSLTDTAMMGTASSAIGQLEISDALKQQFYSHMAIAYAVTYLFGTIGLIEFIVTVAPKLLRIDLRESALALEKELGVAADDDALATAYTRVVTRAHCVAERGVADSISIATFEKQYPSISVERVIRDGKVIERDEMFVLAVGDVIGIYALRDSVGDLSTLVGPEIDQPEAMSFPAASVDVVVTSKEFVGLTIRQAKAKTPIALRSGCFASGITRQGLPLPQLANTRLRRGDVVSLTGRADSVREMAARLGSVRRASHHSDIAVHTFGIVLGSLLGLLSTEVGGIPLELGIGGGVLLVALLIGWCNSRYPDFGALPPAAQWAFSEFGLTAFCAVVGLMAGPAAISALEQYGVSLLLSGVVLTLVPPLVALLVGFYLLKLHPVILLGALAGAQTEPATINKLLQKTGSNLPVLGFTVCYGISSVLFAMAGPVLVFLSH